MKVLFPVEYYPPYTKGGAEISTKLLAEGLVEEGVEVHVLTPNYESFSDTVTEEKGVVVHRFRSLRKFLHKGEGVSQKTFEKQRALFYCILNRYIVFSVWEFGRKISKIQEKEGFDLIHSHNLESVLGLKLSNVDVPKVAHIRDFSPFCISGGKLLNGDLCNACSEQNLRECLETNGLMAKILRNDVSWRRSLTGGFDRYIAISEFVSRTIQEEGIPEESISVVYNPISDEEISELSKSETREKLGLNFDNIVLFVGSLTEKKGAHIISKLAEEIDEADFVVIGDGPLKPSFLNSKIENLHYLGKVPHDAISDYYKAADFVLVPSLWHEPFGRVVIEGQVNSAIPVASGVGGIPELIKDGENGFLLDPNSFDGFSGKVRNLVKQDEGMKKQKKVMREQTIEKFDKRGLAREILGVYRELV